METREQVEPNELETFLRGLDDKERFLVGMIVSTKYLYGRGYRSEGEGDKKTADSLKKVAEGLRNLTSTYGKKYDIPKGRLKEIVREVYRLETSL
jgi:hypothetical protein